MTQTGAPASDTKGVGTGSTTKSISASVWAVALLEALQKAGYKAPITENNIENITRVIGAESAGNDAGFLRDNNPWNLNTYSSPHSSLPGGTIVHEFGIYVQTFPSVEQGIAAMVNQFKANPALLAALNNNASPALFGGALGKSGWSGASYANPTTFPTLTPYNGSSAVGGQGLTWSASAGAEAVKNAAKDAASVVTDPLAAVATLIGDITNPTRLKNIGIFLAGLGLVVGGAVVFFASTKTAKGLESTDIKAA